MKSDKNISESGFTQEEIRMLDKRRARRLAGKSNLLSEDEAFQKIQRIRLIKFK